MKKPVLLASAFFLSGLAYSAESTCVTCHTNPETMKSLFVPPVVVEAEGEG